MKRVLVFAAIGLLMYLVAVVFMVAGLRSGPDVDALVRTIEAGQPTATPGPANAASRPPAQRTTQPASGTPTPAPPDTNSWKQYNNANLLLALKAPPDWQPTESSDSITFRKGQTNTLLVTVELAPPNPNKDNLLRDLRSDTQQVTGELGDLDSAPVVINGKEEAVKYYSFKRQGADRAVALAVVLAEGRVYKIEYYHPLEQYKSPEERARFEAVLKSMKMGPQ